MSNKSREYQLKLNSDYYVVTANDLIKGRQKMTLREAQLLYIAIAQVVKEDKDFKTYTTTVSELASFMGIDENSLYRDLKQICKQLCQRVVEVQVKGENAKKDKWEVFSWINSARYEDGKLTLRLSDDIKPYLLDLERYYSQTLLGTLLTFRSYYTTRLYQYLVAESGARWGHVDEWNFTCEELRELFQVCEKDKNGKYKKYKLPRDLLRYTIKPALEELSNSDYAYIWGYEEHKSRKRGNPIIGVSFRAIFFESKQHKETYLNRKPLLDAYSSAKENKEK